MRRLARMRVGEPLAVVLESVRRSDAMRMWLSPITTRVGPTGPAFASHGEGRPSRERGAARLSPGSAPPSFCAALLVLGLLACGGGEADPTEGTENPGIGGFSFTPNTLTDVSYACERQNSVLDYLFHLRPDGELRVRFTTDANETFEFAGSYTYQNERIRLEMAPGPQMPFPLGLDETSTVIFPALGLVGAFATDEMICVAIGHGLDQPHGRINASYLCPRINDQAASYEENAVEFMHSSSPGGLPLQGSIFRQRNFQVRLSDQPTITRGFGIYRRRDDRFVATFQLASDFIASAFGRTLAPPFEDMNVLTGQFGGGDSTVQVDQLSLQDAPCRLR